MTAAKAAGIAGLLIGLAVLGLAVAGAAWLARTLFHAAEHAADVVQPAPEVAPRPPVAVSPPPAAPDPLPAVDATPVVPGAQSGFAARRSAGIPQVRSGNTDVRGALSKEVIRRVVVRHTNEIRFCYEQALRLHPESAGRVAVKFVISPAGSVQVAAIESSTLGDAATEQCIVQAVRRWTFPSPQGGGIVIVSYPFVLDTQS